MGSDISKNKYEKRISSLKLISYTRESLIDNTFVDGIYFVFVTKIFWLDHVTVLLYFFVFYYLGIFILFLQQIR
jgi:hypothetical protein